MRRRSVYALALAFLIVCVVACLSACGGQSGTTDTSGGEPGSTEAGSQANNGDAQVLRLACPWPVGDPVIVNIEDNFVKKFNEQAGGKYVIELHAGGSLLGLPDEFEAVKSGGVEMAGWPVAVFGSVVPILNFAELPFAVNSIEADAAYNVAMTPLYEQALEKFNIKNVFNFTCQGLDIISVKPVQTLEDWKGLLCQTISPTTAKVVELLGGSGVALDFSEGYQALSKKVIEATLQSGSMVIQFKLHEVAKNITRAYLTPASIAIYMNKGVYDKMPADIQQLVDKLGKEAQEAINANMIELYHTNYDKMAELGMNVYPLPKAERERWAEKLVPYADEMLSTLDPAVADQLRQITEQLDQQYPYSD